MTILQKTTTDTVLNQPEVNFGSKLQTGVLNQLLRNQLSPTIDNSVKPDSKATNETTVISALSAAVDAATEILKTSQLDRTLLHEKLSQLYYVNKDVYDALEIAPAMRKRQFISKSGLVLSPNNSITTILDDLRVRAFIRGLDQAIKGKIANHHGVVQIAYPACGPFAPLVLPLLAYYKAQGCYTAQQLQVRLIDLQPGAIQTLDALVVELGVQDYIAEIALADALEYQSEVAFDLVVLEAMQHGLSREGQLAIALHFSKQLNEDGDFLPKKITVRGMIASLQREFVEQWQDAKEVSEAEISRTINAERTIVGDILSITADTLRKLNIHQLDENNALVECYSLMVPQLASDVEQTLLFCTEVIVWADERIGEYDSGITHPLPEQQICINFTPSKPLPGDLNVVSGDTLQFYYKLNGLPGFLATVVEVNHE
ncbi:hypothetical protein [uncultured Photobacterium sp.]|uniref:hypothetical protein n=1 Tax=uncultured Photobacterium sp. TaxID=173973 RepID=UPI00260EDD9F|nr:hypothetical protein [uncultured Photobacterium sp.]